VRVYLGSRQTLQSVGRRRTSNPGSAVPSYSDREMRSVVTDETLDEGSARNLIYAWYGTDKFSQWAQTLMSLGIIGEDEQSDIQALSAVWNDAVDLSIAMSVNGRKVSPWDAVKALAESKSYKAAGGGSFTGTRTSTSTSIDLTDPATAKAIVNDALSQRLGRAATEEELATLRGVLNAAERAAPTVTTSSTTYQDGDAVSQSSTTSGGLTGAGRQQLILDEAMQKPEYGAYQAATTYFNALMQAVQSPV
jgi:hypothetical protein